MRIIAKKLLESDSGYFHKHAGIALIAGLLLVACSTDEPVSTSATINATEPDTHSIEIRSLSSKPWLISGGDVLLELEIDEGINADNVAVSVNGKDNSSRFTQISSRRLQALLTDLPVGDSTVSASAGGVSATLTLTNYPQSGPIISGPHEQPFYCQTSEFQTVAGSTLGSANDSICSVTTRIVYV